MSEQMKDGTHAQTAKRLRDALVYALRVLNDPADGDRINAADDILRRALALDEKAGLR